MIVNWSRTSEFIRNARIKAGYSQTDISKVLGLGSPQYISNFERGESGLSLDHLINICLELNLNTNKLITTMSRDYASSIATRVLELT